MKRRLGTILVFLLLGAVVNVGVACECALAAGSIHLIAESSVAQGLP